MHRLLLPLFLLALPACEANKQYRQGNHYAETNQEVKAAEAYLAALDARAGHQRARDALAEGVAKEGWYKLLEQAQGLESSRQYPEALAAYQHLAQLTEHLDRYGLLTFDIIDVAERVDAMANAAAEEVYRIGQKALVNRRWEEAVDGFTKALEFKPGYRDSSTKLAAAWYGWAAEDLEAAQYRSAAQRFGQANGAQPGYSDAAARAARIYAALGRHHLSNKSCRQAVRDLRLAEQYAPDTAQAKDLATADLCATTRVTIANFGNPTNVNPGGLAPALVLAEMLQVTVAKMSSEFVEVDFDDSITPKSGSTWPGPHYMVSAKLLQVKVVDPTPVPQARTTEGILQAPCPPGSGTPDSLCQTPVQVTYAEMHSRPSVTIEASYTLTDLHNPKLQTTKNLRSTAEDEVVWAENMLVNGQGFPTAHNDSEQGVRIPEQLESLVNAPRIAPAPDDLARRAALDIAGRLAKEVHDQVDVEQPATDPVKLEGL